MNFCSECGSPVDFIVPAGDSIPRHVCRRCATVHYQNPKLVVGSVAEWQGKVLLCRRAIEPAYGKWTLPAGFMENGESTSQAAARETLEEACTQIRIDALFALTNISSISQVHLFYRGALISPEFASGPESLETALFDEAEIPWPEIAFRSVKSCLEAYFADRRQGKYAFHEADLILRPGDY